MDPKKAGKAAAPTPQEQVVAMAKEIGRLEAKNAQLQAELDKYKGLAEGKGGAAINAVG